MSTPIVSLLSLRSMADKDSKIKLDATERLARAMEKQTSLKWRFLLGMITGLGTAIGATIVATILAYILVQFIQSVGWQETVEDWKDEMRSTISEEVQQSQQEMINEATSRFLR